MNPIALFRGVYLWCFVFLSSMLCSAQVTEVITSVERFSTANGLANNMVNAVLVDKKGVLWIGSENGLNNYLNTDFALYNEASKTAQIVGHNVNRLFQDSQGRIWIGDRFQGLSRYDPRTNVWVRYFNQGNANPKITGNAIMDFVEMNNGDLWVAAFPDVLLHYSNAADSFVHYDLNIESEYQGILALRSLNKTELIVSTLSEGVLLFNTKSNTFRRFDEFYAAFPIKKVGISDEIYTDKKGNIILLHGNEFWVKSPGSAKAKFLDSFPGKDKPECHFTENGDFILASYPFILRYNSEYQLVSKHQLLSSYKGQPLLCVFRSVYKDRQGVLWLGTDEGLLKIDPAKQVFKSFANLENLPNLSDVQKDIRFAYSDSKNQVWLAPRYGKGIARISGMLEQKGTLTVTEFNIEGSKQSHHTVNCLLELHDGRMLASAYSGIYIHTGQRTFVPLTAKNSQAAELSNVWAMFQLDTRCILMGTKDFGLFHFDLISKQVSKVNLFNENGKPYEGKFATWNIFQTDLNTLWLGTSKGLLKLVKKSPTEYVVIPHPSFRNYSVWSYYKSKTGIIWLGTIENGLMAMDSTETVVRMIGLTEGLPSLTICGVIEDDSKQLWVSTASAISRIRFEFENVAVRTFDNLDGLPVEGFNYRAAVNGPLKHLFFASKQGILYFRPDQVQIPKAPATLLVRHCFVSEKEYSLEDVRLPAMVLSPGNNSFSIEPALSDYGNPAKNQYFYKLSEIDQDWKQATGKHPFIQYSSLPIGHYTLQIKAYSPDGIEAHNELQIPIHVQPFLWQTGWFRIVLFVLGMVFISTMIVLIANRLRLRRLLLKSEISSLRLQMNPHFIFNSLNSIQDYIYQNERKLAASYLARFARLIRGIMENAGKSSVTLNEEIEFLKVYLELESLRFSSHFSYALDIDSTIDPEEYTIPPMLLQPLIENALKHGLSGKSDDLRLLICFERNRQGVLCHIADNGVGFLVEEKASDTKHKSMGMNVVKERLRVLNRLHGTHYSLHIQNTNPYFPESGTVVTIQL